MFSNDLDIPRVINTFYKQPNSFATLEFGFEEQAMLVKSGLDKNESTSKGLFRLFIQKVPKDYNNSKLIFHITDNPIGYFYFEPLYYSSQLNFKERILEPKPNLVTNGFIEIGIPHSIELNFIKNALPNESSRPKIVTLKYNNLISVKNHVDDSSISGFNRIALIINK
ncbi:hypothetical protein [Psychroserpens algicola]|uniref:hypothetical protein n=1 Tax=Psychroserpens algicola TaxID=1719034 RepID=UPI0019547222|nr:hypothetical protein [Psychroserpens algicola]